MDCRWDTAEQKARRSRRLSGTPCFKGTRVPVGSLFTNLEIGLSLDEYLDCFPDVTREQAVAVLEYAHKRALQPAA